MENDIDVMTRRRQASKSLATDDQKEALGFISRSNQP
jgi:hypothetical protein